MQSGKPRLRERGLAAVSRPWPWSGAFGGPSPGLHAQLLPEPLQWPCGAMGAGEGVRTGHSRSPARLESSGTSNPGLMGSGVPGLQWVLAHQVQLRVLRPSPPPKQLSSGALVAGGRGRQ